MLNYPAYKNEMGLDARKPVCCMPTAKAQTNLRICAALSAPFYEFSGKSTLAKLATCSFSNLGSLFSQAD